MVRRGRDSDLGLGRGGRDGEKEGLGNRKDSIAHGLGGSTEAKAAVKDGF